MHTFSFTLHFSDTYNYTKENLNKNWISRKSASYVCMKLEYVRKIGCKECTNPTEIAAIVSLRPKQNTPPQQSP